MQIQADTMELRREFADRFLISPQDHSSAVLDGPMEALIEEFDSELAQMKRRFASMDTDIEWAGMDSWLSERGYADPETS